MPRRLFAQQQGEDQRIPRGIAMGYRQAPVIGQQAAAGAAALSAAQPAVAKEPVPGPDGPPQPEPALATGAAPQHLTRPASRPTQFGVPPEPGATRPPVPAPGAPPTPSAGAQPWQFVGGDALEQRTWTPGAQKKGLPDSKWRMPLYKQAIAQGFNAGVQIQGKDMDIGYGLLFNHFDPIVKDGKRFLVNRGQDPNDPRSEIYDADTGQIVQNSSRPGTFSGAGGPGGGPGGGGPGGSNPWNLGSGIEDYIRRLMSGKEAPFSQEITDKMTADAAAKRSSDLANANRSLAISQARGGMVGPAAQAALQANARESRGGLSSDVAGIQTQAALENYKSRVTGLQAGLQELQNRRDYELGQAKNANEARDIQLRYDAQMADVNARLQISKNELAQQERLAASAQGAAGSAAAREQEYWKERFGMQNEREDFMFQRNLPLEFLNMGQQQLGDSFAF